MREEGEDDEERLSHNPRFHWLYPDQCFYSSLHRSKRISIYSVSLANYSVVFPEIGRESEAHIHHVVAEWV